MSDYGEHPHLAPARQERREAAIGSLAAGIGGVGVVLLLTAALVRLLYPGSLRDQPLTPLRAYPSPALQTNTAADMTRFRAEQLQQLNGAWWVDRTHAVVHQPIADAMRDLARDGVPDWPTQPFDPLPRRDELRDGTPAATGVLRGQPRNVSQDSLTPASDAP